MVCEWGMSDTLGAVAYDEHSETNQYGFGGHSEKKYSQETARTIDNEVKRILDEAHETAKQVILAHRTQVELLTEMLIEFETLDAEDISHILTGKWNAEEKRQRLKKADDLHKKPIIALPPVPPPADNALPLPS